LTVQHDAADVEAHLDAFRDVAPDLAATQRAEQQD
jgi:hypothetical protein